MWSPIRVIRLWQQMVRGFTHYIGVTWLLSFGGMLLAATGHRRLAGIAWTSLGAGAIGIAFDRVTGTDPLKFENVEQQRLTEEEVDFLVGHVPFLVVGLVAALVPEEGDRADI